LEVDEVTLPLIALGLSNDSSFVQKLLRTIDLNKWAKGNQKITLTDFAKIFKRDHVSERIIKVIKKTLIQ
jgi:hypothetical protein